MSLPKFLRPEVIPYTSIEIVIAGLGAGPSAKVICAWCDVVLKLGTLPVSHGLCATCAIRFETEGK